MEWTERLGAHVVACGSDTRWRRPVTISAVTKTVTTAMNGIVIPDGFAHVDSTLGPQRPLRACAPWSCHIHRDLSRNCPLTIHVPRSVSGVANLDDSGFNRIHAIGFGGRG